MNPTLLGLLFIVGGIYAYTRSLPRRERFGLFLTYWTSLIMVDAAIEGAWTKFSAFGILLGLRWLNDLFTGSPRTPQGFDR